MPQTPSSTAAVTRVGECGVCGTTPCRIGWHLPPIHQRYPFLPKEILDMAQPAADPTPTPEPSQRAQRLAEDRAKRPAEDRSTGVVETGPLIPFTDEMRADFIEPDEDE